VPAPTITASWAARIACTRVRAAGPVIQRLSPAAVAIRPSRLCASFSVTIGRPLRTRLRKPFCNACASAAITPSATSIPAARRIAWPRPETRGSGSAVAVTTRATPAATRASAQGGVCP